MAELERRIDITLIERGQGRFYRVLASEDRQSGHSVQDTHLFMPGELLELAIWIEQNRAQLEQEAQDDEAPNDLAWSEDKSELPNWAKKESE